MALTDYLEKEKRLPSAETEREEFFKNPLATQVQEAAPIVEPVVDASVKSVKPTSLNWMTDYEYNEQLSQTSPEELERIYGKFDPNSSEPIYQTLYKSTQRQPSVPKERQEKAANAIAGVTDALGMVVQGVTGAKDGLIPVQRQTATGNNAAYVQRMRDIYKADQDRYNSGLFNSVMRDIELGRQGHDAKQRNLLGIFNNSRKLKNEKAIADAKDLLERYKFGEELDHKKKVLAETKTHNRATEGIGRSNANANTLRAGKSGSSGGSSKTVELYSPDGSKRYKVNKDALKFNAPVLFEKIKDQIFGIYPELEWKYLDGELSPTMQADAVLKYVHDYPDAVNLLDEVAETVEKRGDNSNQWTNAVRSPYTGPYRQENTPAATPSKAEDSFDQYKRTKK